MLSEPIEADEDSTMTKQVIWLSFDLGIRGDYENFYAWLDKNKAKDCGESLALVSYAHDGETIVEKLKNDLEETVKFDNRARIYIIYKHPKTNLSKGKFLYGNRKAPAWTGYAKGAGEDDVL